MEQVEIKRQMAEITEAYNMTQDGKFKAMARGDERGFESRVRKLSEMQIEYDRLSRLLPSTTIEDI